MGYSADTQTGTHGRRLANHSLLSKQRILECFCKQTKNIHKFEDCFLSGSVSSNGLKFSTVA